MIARRRDHCGEPGEDMMRRITTALMVCDSNGGACRAAPRGVVIGAGGIARHRHIDR
jgi:hypothetical protein